MNVCVWWACIPGIPCVCVCPRQYWLSYDSCIFISTSFKSWSYSVLFQTSPPVVLNYSFLPALLTAILTNHLAWVPTVMPNGQPPIKIFLEKHSSQSVDMLAKTHPYNPLWAQLGEDPQDHKHRDTQPKREYSFSPSLQCTSSCHPVAIFYIYIILAEFCEVLQRTLIGEDTFCCWCHGILRFQHAPRYTRDGHVSPSLLLCVGHNLTIHVMRTYTAGWHSVAY